MNKDGSGFEVLHDFTDDKVDGYHPRSRLIEASDGALCGTTQVGGGADGGVVFKLNKDGKGYEVLHTFGAAPGDGSSSFAPLAEGSDGSLYGTTSHGGPVDNGTVFELNRDGSAYSILHCFSFGTNGYNPRDSVEEGSDGVLCGTSALDPRIPTKCR